MIYSCENCIFFERFHADEPYGACHRNAPRVGLEKFPDVQKRDWCGEWQSKEKRILQVIPDDNYEVVYAVDGEEDFVMPVHVLALVEEKDAYLGVFRSVEPLSACEDGYFDFASDAKNFKEMRRKK
jgi:hypothetical protein